jgi:hypothetical protein
MYDGLQDAFYNSLFEAALGENRIGFKISDFKNIYSLKAEINPDFFAEIIKSIKAKRNEPFESYVGTKGLAVEYLIQKNDDEKEFLIVVSTGESQPGRYMIFLEGVWEWPIK